jgi:anti-anti-sigma factor
MASLDNGATALGSIETEPDGSGAQIVKLIGEIDISNADAIGRELDRVVAGTSTATSTRTSGRVIIDLEGLEFMDSSGIAMLLRAVGGSASVEIRNPSRVVRRIIECTGLTDVLRLA